MGQIDLPPLHFIEKELQENNEEDDDNEVEESDLQGEPGCDVIESGDMGVLFLQQLKLTSNPNERTDFPNFRSLLWRAMAQFPDRVEPRSRELSPLLLRFIRLVSKIRTFKHCVGCYFYTSEMLMFDGPPC